MKKKIVKTRDIDTDDIVENGSEVPFEGIKLLPVLVRNSLVVFPQTISPALLDGDMEIAALDNAELYNRLLVMIPEATPEAVAVAERVPPGERSLDIAFTATQAIMPVGTVCRVIKTLRFPDGTARILVRGLGRVRCVEMIESKNAEQSLLGRFTWCPEAGTDSLQADALGRTIMQRFGEVVEVSPNLPDEIKAAMSNLDSAEQIGDVVADTMNFSFAEKSAILVTDDLEARLKYLFGLLSREFELLKLGAEIQSQVQESISRSNREHYLREQLEVIRRELGENVNPDIQTFRQRLAELDLPEHAYIAVIRELDRMEMIPTAAAEYHVSANYVDWILSVPWNTYTEDRLDIRKAAEILDQDHYGLKEVKDRILEHLAVLQLKDNKKSPILCFVGPPGVGKTSLGQSIARAMGRNFVRVSLGGIRDETEIRGHRRTYVGALPGRIITGMKKAGANNPVFMLDELDKLSRDFHGDPGAALLEALDPQQNNTFNDHFLDLDYDLSPVFFIATANLTETIPAALQDRLEIIRLAGYTAYEKRLIAKNFLVPRQLDANGIDAKQLKFNDSALDEIITYYTMESGVRTLERTIGSVCRKFARKLLDGEIFAGAQIRLNAKDIKSYLGGRKFLMDEALKKPEVGVATGLAWTSAGGCIMPVEVSAMPGKGELKLTGSLGDVLKESAQAAFSYIRSHANAFGIDNAKFTTQDFHIHLPDGSTPKDGPSAGITLTIALISVLTNRPIDCSYAMTGEITLRGKVTAIGGVKEKSMAALRAGIKKIILPESNRKDLEDIPVEIQNEIEFHFVSTISDALPLLLPNTKSKRKK